MGPRLPPSPSTALRGLDRVPRRARHADRPGPGGPDGRGRRCRRHAVARAVRRPGDLDRCDATGSGDVPSCESADEVDAGIEPPTSGWPTPARVVVIGGGAAAVGSGRQLATPGPTSGSTSTSPASARCPSTTAGSGRRSAASWRRPGSGCTRVTGPSFRTASHRPDHRRARRVEHRPAAGRGGRGAVGDRAGRPNTDWVPPELLDERRLRARRPRPAGRPAPTASSPSATSPRPTRCAPPRATSPTSCWPATSAPTSTGSRSRRSRAEASLGLGARPAGRRATVSAPKGRGYRIPRRAADRMMQPLIVNRGFYRGVRRCGAAPVRVLRWVRLGVHASCS